MTAHPPPATTPVEVIVVRAPATRPAAPFAVRRIPVSLAAVLGLALLVADVAAQAQTEPVYREPSPQLVAIADAPPTPFVSLSPDRSRLLLLERPNLPGIEEVAAPEIGLAGTRINPRRYGPSRTRPLNGLSVVDVVTGEARAVQGLPASPRLGNVTWSPDGRHAAFTHEAADGIELWVADVGAARARRLTRAVLNLCAEADPEWLDAENLLCTIRPEGQGAPPAESLVPKGPVIQESLGEKAAAVTWQDLLEDPHDEALFEHYFASRLARVSLKGKVTPLGEAGLIAGFQASPDGEWIVVETLHRPWSYLVPMERYPRRVEIVDRSGRVARLVADLPLHESVPVTYGSVPTGPRDFSWRDDAPAVLVWAEALDGGDAGTEAAERDRLFLLAAPFAGDPAPWVTLGLRYGGVTWGRDDLALVSEWWWQTRTMRTWVAKPGAPDATPVKLWDRSWQDRYGDPGRPVQRRDERGRLVLATTGGGNTIFLIGEGASPEGNRPFFDTLDLATGESTRRFRSEAPWFERPVAMLDDAGGMLLTSRESVDEPTNYFVRGVADGSLRALTAFPHPTPGLKGLTKELIRYARADGVQLNGTLYLPPGYDASQGPLPAILWAYPEEFKSAEHAGQVKDSPYRFDRVSAFSPLLFLPLGYAVLDDPTIAIVGEGDEEPNDTFKEQLVGCAQAAVDELARRGVADPRRVAVGGHSYGAFMTAHLLAYSDLFAAGIARSGAYNRTLTPFGFQSEERTLWEAPEAYVAMSPFMHADSVNEPILLIHGAADNNPGTYPMQSERFYDALRGHGARARLVMLPHESHGYRARESLLHMLWEQERWLDRWVKHRPADETAAAGAP